MITNVLKTLGSLRATLVAAAGIPFLIAASAFAQNDLNTPAAGEATGERIVVTGSYIPTAENVTASPVDTLSQQDVKISGGVDVLTVLQRRNPDFVGAGNLGSTNANISSGTTLGGSAIQIRGFPTLVLFEGRRIADSAAIAAGGAQFSDVNLFPATLISRIEVLKDGASALYGSEAIGGVINIFLKDNFQGVELGFRYGTTVEGAVAERRGFLIAGLGNDTTQITVGAQYYEIDPLFMRQRGYSDSQINGTTTYGGVGRDNLGGSTHFYLLNGSDPSTYAIGLNSPFAAGVVPGSVPLPLPGDANQGQYAQLPQAYRPSSQTEVLSFNLANKPTSTLDQSRSNFAGSFDHQICGKQLELFGNFMYTYNHSESFLNAQPLSNGTGVIIPPGRVGSNNDVTSPDYIPGVTNTIWNPFQLQIDSSTLSGDNRLFANQRYQTNPRIFTQDSNFYRILVGARSQITADWMFETAAYYSNYQLDFVNANLVNAPQLNAMIAGTAVDNAGLQIPALDFFARNPVGNGPGQVTADQFATVFGSNFRNLTSFQRVFDAKVVGFPFSLPGGKVGFSIGGEYRVEGFKVSDSPEIFVGSVPIGIINVRRDIGSFYMETSIPIVGSEMKVPFIYNLELDLAGRFDHYQGVSEDAKVPKVTLRYQPIPDLTIRATFSNSFIAPTLYQLDGPVGTGFSTGITLNGNPQDQAQVLSGSNPDLIPSTAQSWTAGLVYSPKYVPGLTITCDYFNTLQQQIVGTLGGPTILNSVENLGPASPYASLVGFNNFPGQPGSNPVTAPHQLDGNLASVFYIDNLRNLGAQRAAGFDLSLNYTLDLRAWGQLQFGCAAVIFTQYDLKTTALNNYYNVLGLDFPEGLGANPDYKVNFLFEYRYGGLVYSANANYIPEMLNANGLDPEHDVQSTYQTIGDYFAVDMRLSYEFMKQKTASAPPVVDSKDAKDGKNVVPVVEGCNWREKLLDGLTIAVGCNNIFNEQPPFVDGANSNTDLSAYDPYGRFVYFEISKKF